MNSMEGESIEFDKIINPFDANKNVRGVEDWLCEIEKMMKTTLFTLFKNCIKDYYQEKVFLFIY